MKKNLLLLLLPIAYIILGFLISDLVPLPIVNLLFTFPFFEILILLLAVFVFWQIFKNNGVKISLVLFIPIYLLLLVGVFFLSREIFGFLWLTGANNMISARERGQQDETIKVGKINKVGNSINYECQKCGYKITFPNDWGYEEGGYDSSSGWSQLKLVTSNYNFGTLNFSGERFWIFSTAGDPFYIFQQATNDATLKTDTFNVGTSNVKAKIYEKHQPGVLPPNNVYLAFDSLDKKKHFGIQVDYQDEQEMNQNLNILLTGFEFVNQ